MASSRDIYSATRSIRQTQDLEIGDKSRTALEATMVANAAAGRVNEAAVIMQMLGRTQKELALDEVIKSLNILTETIQANNEPTKPAVIDYDKLAEAISKRQAH